MTLGDIAKFIANKGIELSGLREHNKASEKYVDVVFSYPGQRARWHGSVPYHYRRAGIFLEDPKDVAALIKRSFDALRPKNRSKWILKEKSLWRKEYSGRRL